MHTAASLAERIRALRAGAPTTPTLAALGGLAGLDQAAPSVSESPTAPVTGVSYEDAPSSPSPVGNEAELLVQLTSLLVNVTSGERFCESLFPAAGEGGQSALRGQTWSDIE